MKNNLFKKVLKSTAAKLIAAFLMSGAVQETKGATFLWNNTGSNYTTASSWTNGIAPASSSSTSTTDDIQFGNYGANNNSVSITSNRTAASVTFLAGANSYTITTATNIVYQISTGLTNASSATQTFNATIENGRQNNTWANTLGGTMVFNNNVFLTTSSSSSSRTFTLAGNGTMTFNGSLLNGGSATAAKVVVNGAGGTFNFNNVNTLGGGVAITAGTVNFSNAGALGTGVLELGSTTGTTYGNSVLNNASGAAINLTGITGILWTGTSPAGIQIGTTASTSANNIDFGTGLVTAGTDRSMNIAGTGVTISMGTLTASGTAGSYTYKIDGVGNTLDLDGWRISGAATPTQAVQHKISGTANVNIGAIVNGTGAFANGVGFNSDGTTRLTGNNTYTGATEFTGGGTNIISGNNSAAVGNVTIAGTSSGSGKTPVVRLDNINAISSSSSLMGSSSSAQMGTIDFNAGTSYVLNAYLGNNMTFTNSFGQASTVTFTNVANTLTSSASNAGGRSLLNTAANLTVVFDGSLDIGSTTTALNNTFGGAGNWLIKGNVSSTTADSVRGLNKTGAGQLELRGINTYNGDTTVSAGTLLVATGASITGSTAQLTGGTLNVQGTIGAVTQSGGTLLVSGIAGTTIVNSGTSTVNVGGTIGSTTINGSLLSVNGNAGDVLVNSGGTLGGSGSVQGLTLNGGTVAPGNSPGLLTAYELNGSNGTFQFQLGAPTTRGTTYDAINVTTLLTLGANTAFTFETLNSYTYAMGDVYDLFDFASIDVSAFDNAVLLAALPDLDTANSNLTWNVNSFNADGVVNVIPEPSTFSLMLFGATGLIALRIMRRKNG